MGGGLGGCHLDLWTLAGAITRGFHDAWDPHVLTGFHVWLPW